MTRNPARFSPGERLSPLTGSLTVILAGAAAAGGLAIGIAGMKGLALIAAPVVAVLALTRPFWILVLVAFLVPIESAFAVEGTGTAVKFAGLGLAGGWLWNKFVHREGWSRIATSKTVWLTLLFAAVVGLSALWAEQPLQSTSGFVQLVQLAVLAIITIDLCQDRLSIERVAKGLILGGLAAAVLTVIELQSGIRRAGETAAGINGTAELLVTLLPVVFYFVQSRGSALWKAIGPVYLAAGMAAVLATFSRMSGMLLPVVAGFLLVRSLRSREARRWLMPVIASSVLIGGLLVPWDRVGDRMKTVVPYISATLEPAGSAANPVMSSRGYHLLVGVRIFQDHPVLGVGYANYGWHFLHRYQHSVPGADVLYLRSRSPHSSHIGILADLGLVGAAIWVSLLLSFLVPLSRAWRALKTDLTPGGRRLYQLTEALFLSALLQALPYAFYGPNQKQKLFWLIVALCVAVVNVFRHYRPARLQPDTGAYELKAAGRFTDDPGLREPA